MARPSFQFYPADWKGNAKLRRCSEAARGAWMDIICSLHDSDEYGVLRWPLADLARSAGIALKLARELADKDVLKGSDTPPLRYTHTPRHAGKDLPEVILVESLDGPCWFSSRMVKDEWRRKRSGGDTKFTAETQPSRSPGRRLGEDLGDGSLSSTSSPSSEEETPLRGVSAQPAAAPPKPRAKSRRSIPEGFPSELEFDWARQHWLAKGRADLCAGMADHAEQFRDHHAGRATMSADWPGSWRTWARNALNFTRAPPRPAQQTGLAAPFKPLSILDTPQ
jgi:hypothetical protein